MKSTFLTIAALLALFVPALPAQTSQPATDTPPGRRHLTIQQRKALQQKRIGEGVENGSLTAGEAARIEGQESRLNRQEQRMKADGNFTNAERRQIQKEQNGLSREIYHEKHDAQQQPPVAGRITARDRAQQQRIGEGIENGSLTAGEAARLEKQESNLNRREAKMAASGGKLTAGERNAINRQQNAMSRRIYRQKHDAQRR
jgi:hypothetical protein